MAKPPKPVRRRDDKKPTNRASATRVKKVDKRGTPKGKGAVKPKHGGRIGNPPFKATDEQRRRVIEMIAGGPNTEGGAQHWFIAQDLGISQDTLERHFAKELQTGTHQVLALIGASMMKKALDGDHDSQKYVLARRGGWKTTTAVEASGPNGGPIEYRDLSDEELDARIAALSSHAINPAKD